MRYTFVVAVVDFCMATPTLTDTPPELSTPIADIETPAVLVDLDVMDRNIEEFATFAESNDVSLRSHAKTHKIPDIAHKQIRRTDGGILCQTLSECETMAHAGIDDIYLSYSVVGDRKLRRAMALAETLDHFATTVDGPGNIDPLQAHARQSDQEVHVVLELDCGMGRTGVPLGQRAVEMAQYIDDASHLVFDGVMAYEAHLKRQADSKAALEERCMEVFDEVAKTVDTIEDAGIPVPEVKAGGTATSKLTGKHPIVTEVNPGMYLFNDTGEIKYRPWEVGKEDCAVTVLSTVISSPSSNRAVVDAGSKSISMDTDRMPVPKNGDDIEYVNYSEEHGWLETSDVPRTTSVGDRLSFIVPHVCTTINLHDTLVGVRDGVVEEVWSIQARGDVN